MVKKNNKCHSKRGIIFIAVILVFFFGAGVIAGNLEPINNIKIAFSNSHEINIITTKNTVEEILKENHIEILEDEIVVPSLTAEVQNNDTIKILKKSETNTIATLATKGENIELEELLKAYSPIVEKIVVEQVEIPYETITKDVSNGSSNTTEEVVQVGENGIKEVTYKVKYQNEVEIEREEISSEIIKEPTNKIVNVNTAKTVTSRSSVTRTTTTTATTSYTVQTGEMADKVRGITPTVATLNASAYCSCYICCGSSSNGTTASGETATAWYTVAAGSGYPLGTIIYIPSLSETANGGWFVVQDRGGAISNGHIDIFVGNHSEALNFGRQDLECYIYVK